MYVYYKRLLCKPFNILFYFIFFILQRITKIKQDMKAKDLNKSDEAVRQLRRDVNFLKSKATTLALPAIKKEAKKCTNEAITKVNSLFKQILVAHDTCTQLARKSL